MHTDDSELAQEQSTGATEAAPSISKAQAKKILKADLANMVKKVGNGKTLSTAERAILTALSDGQAEEIPTTAYAKKQSELAKILGVKDRKTIQRWLKEPGNPGKEDDGRYNVVAWKNYAKLKGYSFGDEPDGISQTSAKAKQTLLQNERLEMKILEDKGELIPKTVAQQIFSKLVISAKTRCFTNVTRFVTLARMAASTAEAHEEIRKEMILIWQSLEDGSWRK